MGKISTAKYATGVVNVNGQQKASHYKKGNTVYSNYDMNDTEKNIYNFSQNSFLENLPNINVFSADTQKSLQNQLNAYTQNGLDTINNYYTPMLSNLKTDIASRFGNFDNSAFMDKLSSIEENRSKAMSSFTQDVLAKQNELYNDELSRRYNYLNFLNNVQNQSVANALGYMNLAGSNSSSGTAYNQYVAQNQNSLGDILSSIGQGVGTAFGVGFGGQYGAALGKNLVKKK